MFHERVQNITGIFKLLALPKHTKDVSQASPDNGKTGENGGRKSGNSQSG